MDSCNQPKRRQNPVETASFLSKITYFFTVPLFRKGEIHELDIYENIKSYSTTTLGNKLETEWQHEKKQEHPWLLNSILNVFGRRILLIGLLHTVIHSAAMTAKPLLVSKIMKFFSSKEKDLSLKYGIIYCSALVISLVLFEMMKLFCAFQIDQLTQKIKIACSTLVYRKLLKSVINEDTRGQAITLITKDINASDALLFCIYHLVQGVIQIAIMSYIMYTQIGIAAFIGFSWLLIYFPVQIILAKLASVVRLRAASTTDKRLRETQEVFTAARVIKMYTWEAFHLRAVENIRRKEMSHIRFFRSLEAVAMVMGTFTTKLIFCISIVSYIALGNKLNAEKAFTVTTCLGMLFGIIQIFTPLAIGQFGNFVAAMKRFTAFLAQPEIIREPHDICKTTPYIVVKDLTVKLSNTVVLNNVSFRIEKGLTMIKGPTGSGKSTLLLSLMNETQKTTGIIDVKGSVSYASQEPWLFPGTLRQNIIFGEHYDSSRYKTIIRVCCLAKDFDSFSDGDNTYLTDRGLNLSRGQKTRINLARCVYKTADIYLLDDCLAALDNQVAKNIFKECIKGFLKNKICIMATHNEDYILDVDHVLELKQGNLINHVYNKVAKNESNYKTTILENNKGIDIITEKTAENIEYSETAKLLKSNNRNIYKESNEEGSITKRVYYFYFSSGGIWIFVIILAVLIIAQCVSTSSDYFVTLWVNAEQKLANFTNEHSINSTEYKILKAKTANMLYQYCGITVTVIVLGLSSYIAYLFFTCKAAINIHRQILSNILSGGMQFFDENLAGNVLNKFSRDLSIIDEQLPVFTYQFMKVILIIIATLVMVSMVKPLLFIPSSALLIILFIARRIYIPTSRSIRRLEGSTRSPIIGQLTATVDGLTTIRANQMQSVLIKEFERHQDLYNSVIYMNISTSTAFSFLLDMLCTLYIGIILTTLMYFRNEILAGEVGLVITQSISLSGMLLQVGIRMWAEVENLMTSVERTMIYTKIKPETSSGRMPTDWPNKGKITYNDVCLKYPLTGDLVLNQITIDIAPKEKLGIVGRTGAGKSSLISALFRLYDFDGAITIDHINTGEISIQYLRSKISIIPQDPFLFSGTIRENLDPHNKFSDKELWSALEQVEMKPLVSSLNAAISEGGTNLSVGQKQLICLARAILRENVILVLDEATANLDSNTDLVIQNTIKNKFTECTVITIAHRISTVISSDKILVIDQGRVVEFGSPQSLLNDKHGLFFKMVNDAGLQ